MNIMMICLVIDDDFDDDFVINKLVYCFFLLNGRG